MNDESPVRFNPEGQPAFPIANTETDDSAASPAEETDAEDTSSSEEDNDSDADTNDGVEDTEDDAEDGGDDDTEEGKKPVHTPSPERWVERETDWKDRFNDQETRHLESITKLREEFQEKYGKPAAKGPDLPSEVPSWFGGDEKQWEEFKQFNSEQIKAAQAEAKAETTKATETEQTAIREATDYLKSEVTSIKTDKTINPDGVKVDQNKLLKFVLDNELVDTQGRWNYRAGFKLMQAGVKSINKETIKEKKQIAGATTSEGRAETEKSTITTSEDFQNPANKPW